MVGKGSAYQLVQIGARLHPLESLVVYLLPYFLIKSKSLAKLFWLNVYVQLALFLPVVQLPALLKSRMSYVDIGWPVGLVGLALTTMTQGEGICLGGCCAAHAFFCMGHAWDLERSPCSSPLSSSRTSLDTSTRRSGSRRRMA